MYTKHDNKTLFVIMSKKIKILYKLTTWKDAHAKVIQ